MVHAGHGAVAEALATLSGVTSGLPAVTGVGGRNLRQDAGRPVPKGLRQEGVAGALLGLDQRVEVLSLATGPLSAPTCGQAKNIIDTHPLYPLISKVLSQVIDQLIIH